MDDSAADDGTHRLLAFADSVLRHHTPDADGWCYGCLSRWRRLAPYPCETVKWANAVRAAYTEHAD